MVFIAIPISFVRDCGLSKPLTSGISDGDIALWARSTGVYRIPIEDPSTPIAYALPVTACPYAFGWFALSTIAPKLAKILLKFSPSGVIFSICFFITRAPTPPTPSYLKSTFSSPGYVHIIVAVNGVNGAFMFSVDNTFWDTLLCTICFIFNSTLTLCGLGWLSASSTRVLVRGILIQKILSSSVTRLNVIFSYNLTASVGTTSVLALSSAVAAVYTSSDSPLSFKFRSGFTTDPYPFANLFSCFTFHRYSSNLND